MKQSRYFFLVASILMLALSYRFFAYTYELFNYRFEWEPTDGDHLNFIVRILYSKPIYVDKAAGWVLSIYNPLYHYVVAMCTEVIGTSDGVLKTARQLSIIFVLAPIGAFITINNRKNETPIFVTFFFAILLLYPTTKMYLVDLVNVSPNSFLIFFFFLAGLIIDKYFSSNSRNYALGFFLSILVVLVYLTKQQGIIIFPLYALTIILLKESPKVKLRHFLILFLAVAAGVGLLEYLHDGIFLQSTLIDVSRMVRSNYEVSLERYLDFFINNAVFITAALFYVYRSAKKRKFDVWSLSFLLHIPFLLKILGNAGGGNNYFGTFWVTLVVISYKLILDLQKEARVYAVNFTAFLLGANALFGIVLLNKDLDTFLAPSKEVELTYEMHLKTVADVLSKAPYNAKILANRNIGSLVTLGVDISIEGSSTFNYLRLIGNLYDSQMILRNVFDKKYDLIFTGIQRYPADIEIAIAQNYKIVKVSAVNLYFGKMGEISIYSPRGLE